MTNPEPKIPTLSDRLAERERPEGSPVMHQSWDKLLFLHWQVPVETLRPLVPEPLVIDTFEGLARFSITPLTIYDVRPAFLPAVPYFSWLHELNVRTYVHFEGVPGVWFFSLDANNLAAVLGARFFFELPYYSANIILEANDDRVTFKSARSDRKARFAAEWEIGKSLPPAVPGSLDFFLVERYSLYTADDLNIYRCRIHHKPWPLQETKGFSNYHSTMAEIAGLPTPAEDPMLHCGGPVNVDVWPLEKIADRS